MNKKPMIIVGILFALIIISLIIYLVLSLTTDIFKPTREIFETYFKQDVADIDGIIDFSKEEEYVKTLVQENYRDNAKLNFKYLNSQGNLEEFNINSNGITNNSNKNSYRTIGIKYGENYDIMNVEYLQEDKTHGLLFSNVVKQFVSADIDDLQTFFNIIGIDFQNIQNDKMIELAKLIIGKKQDLKKVCFNYISKLNNKKFSKNKSTKITLSNGEEKEVKSFSLNLTGENTKEVYLELLKEISMQDEINKINTNKMQFPDLSIVIYVLNNKTVRITAEMEKRQIKIDLFENEISIKYNHITDEEIKTADVDIKREENGATIDYNDSYNNSINVKYDISEEASVKSTNLGFKFKNDFIKGIELSLNQKIETSNTTIEGIQKKFENQENVNISRINSNNRNSALNSLMKRIDTLIINKNNQVNSEILNMVLKINKELEDGYQGIKEKQRKEFNNQFLPYIGQNIEKEIIYNLLDLSGRNMEKYEEIDKDLYKIYITQGVKNINLSEELKTKIKTSDKKFSVNFAYDSEGKINVVEIKGYKE